MKYGIRCIANDGIERSDMPGWSKTARGWEAWCTKYSSSACTYILHLFDNVNDAFLYKQNSAPDYGKVIYLIEEYNE